MATIGQALTVPEAGWRRYDDTDSRIKYIGDWRSSGGSQDYNSTGKYTYTPEDYIYFKFYGTKIRLLGSVYTNRPQTYNADIYIDDINCGSINQYNTSATFCTLDFEYNGLTEGIHIVKIVVKNCTYPTMLYGIDAIDIDSDGYLVHPIFINLTASAGDSQITLNWEAVTDTTGYNVKRSTTAGGPYTTIASHVSGTNYVDSDVINGTTYYYVVSAITAGEESDNSNEASATPVEEVEAMLRATMIDSSEREYKLTMSEIDGFISWFDREIGTGTTVYALNKVLTNSKEYLAFDKIISFEVIPVAE